MGVTITHAVGSAHSLNTVTVFPLVAETPRVELGYAVNVSSLINWYGQPMPFWFPSSIYTIQNVVSIVYNTVMQYNRIFAIGDVHGHYDELMLLYNQLLVKAKLNPKKDRLIFIGDMIDGGTQTKQVLEKCLQWETKYPHWIFLLGNHEDLMIDALGNQQKYQSWDLWWKQGGKATTYSYYPRKASVYEKALMQPENYIPPQHINWLKTRPLWHEEKDYFFVHAGLVPDITIKQHTNGNNIKLWGEMLWIRDQFLDSDYDWGKKIVFGHTPFRKPKIEKNKIAIDTGFRFNGHLSAVELPAEKIYMQQNISSPSW